MPPALQRDCGFASSSPPQPSRLPLSSTSHTYSDSGIRVKQVTTQGSTVTTTEFVVDHANPTGYAQTIEQKVDDDIVRSYTIGLDEITQAVTDNPGPAAVISQFLHDGKGSVRQLADAAAELIAAATKGMADVLKLDYDAYGNAINYAAETVATALLYNGEFVDAVTGQQYLRARWYDQATGRFNRVDPFAGLTSRPGTLHKYGYSLNDPLTYSDPTGEIPWVISLVLGGIGGATSGLVLGGLTHRLGGSPGEVLQSTVFGMLGGFAIGLAYGLGPHGNNVLVSAVITGISFMLIDAVSDYTRVHWHNKLPLGLTSPTYGTYVASFARGFGEGALTKLVDVSFTMPRWIEVVAPGIVSIAVSAGSSFLAGESPDWRQLLTEFAANTLIGFIRHDSTIADYASDKIDIDAIQGIANWGAFIDSLLVGWASNQVF